MSLLDTHPTPKPGAYWPDGFRERAQAIADRVAAERDGRPRLVKTGSGYADHIGDAIAGYEPTPEIVPEELGARPGSGHSHGRTGPGGYGRHSSRAPRRSAAHGAVADGRGRRHNHAGSPGTGESMKSIPNHAPTSVAALDERDPAAGNASHVYGIQYGGPSDMVKLQFQHGPRGIATSTAGVFEDDLLAILEDRIAGFQSGPFACAEHADAMAHIQGARDALARRVAARIAKGVLGVNEKH